MVDGNDLPKLTGKEHLKYPRNWEVDLDEANVGQFWSWAFSELLDNTLRGEFGEYLVALALDPSDPFRFRKKAWSSWDLQINQDLRIEVKTSGRSQSWHKDRPWRSGKKKKSSPSWGVRMVKVYCEETGESSEKSSRPADLYVFCFHDEKCVDKAETTDLSQWEFYVVSKEKLEQKLDESSRQSIGVTFLSKLKKVKFDQLRDEIVCIAKDGGKSTDGIRVK